MRLIRFVFAFLLLSAYAYCSTAVELNNRAIKLFRQEKIQEAIEKLDMAIMVSPRTAILYNNRGYMKLAAGDTFGALSDFNTAIELGNDRQAKVLAYFNRGKLKFQQQDFEGAVKDLSYCIAINPDYAPAYRARAEAFQKSAEQDLKKYGEQK